MELDRESVERYLLNISVSAGDQHDYALVSVTVLDVNDNVPRFVFDNDLGLSTYFGAVSSSAPAFTRILTAKVPLCPVQHHPEYFRRKMPTSETAAW